MHFCFRWNVCLSLVNPLENDIRMIFWKWFCPNVWYLSTFSFSFTKQKPLINGHGKIRPLLFPPQFIEFAIASIKRFFRSTFSNASISEIVQVCNKIKRQKWKQELFVIMPPFHDRERVTNFWNNSRKISNLKKKREIFQLKKGKFRNDRTRRQKQTYETARASSRSKKRIRFLEMNPATA